MFYRLPNKKPSISTYAAHRGFRKNIVKVTVGNESGQERTVLMGEVDKLKPDRRKRQRKDYVYLTRLNKFPRLDLTMNVATGRISLCGHLGYHFFYANLEEEELSKLFAAYGLAGKGRVLLRVLESINRVSKKSKARRLKGLPKRSYYDYDNILTGTKFFREVFLKLVRQGRRKWFKSSNARRLGRPFGKKARRSKKRAL